MNIVFGILCLVWAAIILVPVMMSIMAFDSPGSENNKMLIACVASLWVHLVSLPISSLFLIFNWSWKLVPIGFSVGTLAGFVLLLFIVSKMESFRKT